DRDFYRIPIGVGPRSLTARLQGLPNMDLILEVFDGQARRIAKADAAGSGQGEWLPPTHIGPGEAYLVVREVWVDGRTPAENVTDEYELTVTWGTPQPDWELEPDDTEATATPISVGATVRGYLAALDDVDVYALTPAEAGHLEIKVAAPVIGPLTITARSAEA